MSRLLFQYISKFLKNYVRYCFILINIFNYFDLKTETVNFSPEKRARTAKLSVLIDSAVKNTSKYVLWSSVNSVLSGPISSGPGQNIYSLSPGFSQPVF